jgi:ornithine cyclodeaminase
MRIVELPEILAAIDHDEIFAAVESGFRRLARGEAEVMAVGHIPFIDPPGDCHVKGGYLHGDDVFVVKMANSFYRNSRAGLPTSNGFMAVASARTGAILAILHDQGMLTDLRTAMAGALAARVIAKPGPITIGVVGSGIQAKLQAEAMRRFLDVNAIMVWARRPASAVSLAAELGGEAVPLSALCARADLIVTTTPSTEPILSAEMIRPGTRIVAVGADAPGKRELDVKLVAGARIVVDAKAQCIDHGEAGWAIRAGLIDEARLLELGHLLGAPPAFGPDETVIADLTGVAIQDVQIAKVVWSRITAMTKTAV